ncbi:MAG: fructosamine kinase family protein [Pseudomonadota bacterium]
MPLWEEIAKTISQHSGDVFVVRDRHGLGGGCINSAFRISDGRRSYFVKLNSGDKLAMFEAEHDGLHELAGAGAIRVPQPLATGAAEGRAYIVMEDLPLGGSGSQAQLGRELAALHRHGGERFGWIRDNTIGSTPQSNQWNDSWITFWREQRLGAQLTMAKTNGGSRKLLSQGERLLADFPKLFDGYAPVPSLLHGDLWSGNYAFMSRDGRYADEPGGSASAMSRDGVPVIFDPAVYYGDREADIAMTELFGGFRGDFYAAYEESWPLDPGYKVRKTFYNLYHIINHFNMFGGGYGSQAEGMMGRLLAELS